MSKKCAGKIAVVTGGSPGMGLATVGRFVQEGMDHVFITGQRKDSLDARRWRRGPDLRSCKVRFEILNGKDNANSPASLK